MYPTFSPHFSDGICSRNTGNPGPAGETGIRTSRSCCHTTNQNTSLPQRAKTAAPGVRPGYSKSRKQGPDVSRSLVPAFSLFTVWLSSLM